MKNPGKHLNNALILYHCPGMTFQLLKKLSQQANGDRLCEASRAELLSWGLKTPLVNYLLQPDRALIEKEMQWEQEASHHHIVRWDDDAYPPLLREISDPPLLLFVQGQVSLLAQQQLAIVGSRQGSTMGCETAWEFASFLSRYFVIASGFARGIDASAHGGALRNQGKTIAVMGTGLQRIYPKRHASLAEHIMDSGALVSEFPLDTPPHPAHFPKRNRIISGMSLGVLVVEAALKSGSLITAQCALEQGREVFAIPGSIHNPLARGCHHLIRQGAKLVEKAQDILEELPALVALTHQPDLLKQHTLNQDILDDDAKKLLANLGYEAVSIDTLVQRSGLTASTVSSQLLLLEVGGYVAWSAGGYQLTAKCHN